ncbi:MAG TPA: hypothetical protein VJ579_04975 [Candidatus Paceibacterota bacterium]|nr:hypothetical protein [Candidatus Paceibacterota bacterium]
MNIKQFLLASLFFTIVSLSAIFGLGFLYGKLLLPPSSFDEFVTGYLGQHGPLIVVVTSFALSSGLVFLITKKYIVPRLTRPKA